MTGTLGYGVTLAPYQLVAFRRLMDNDRYGLFDEQGVGKTHPTIIAAAETKMHRPRLVTAPGYLLPNWKREIERTCGTTKIVIAAGDCEPAKKHDALATADADWVLTSYNMWSNYVPLTPREKKLVEGGATVQRKPRFPELFRQHWPLLAFDEAHRLRGRNSMWTKELNRLRNADSKNKGSRYWFLTGTPQVRDAGDVFTLLRLMDRETFTSYWNFVTEWCDLTETPWEKIVGAVKKGREEAFRAMLGRYSIRRLLDDIPELSQLEAVTKVISVTLPASVYKTMKDLIRTWTLTHPDLNDPKTIESGGELVYELRMLASLPPTNAKPKIDAVIDLLEDNQNQPVLVFAWFRKTVEHLAAEIERRTKRRTWTFTGDTAAGMKQVALNGFRASQDGVLVATIAALKEGENLQNASCQVYAELSDLPSEVEQCIGRSKRRGQTRPVRVYFVVAEKCIDVRTHKNMTARRRNILRSMLEDMRREEW